MKTCLSIAGSDPSGGAGIQSDLKVFHNHACYGCSITTLETIQNTLGVKEIFVQQKEIITKQIGALEEDFRFDAIKLGALGNEIIVKEILASTILENSAVIIDPVFISSSGKELFSKNAAAIYKEFLLNKAFLITPNLDEASALAGINISTISEMKKAAEIILKLGANAVLIKGGHLAGDTCTDLLLSKSGFLEITNPKIETKNTHGTGCYLSATITALVAKKVPLESAVKKACELTYKAIKTAPRLGKGNGPLNFLIKSED